MLSKSLIQLSVDGWSCVPSQLFTWGQTMVEVMKIMVTPSKAPMHALLYSAPPTLQQATTDPRLRWRLLDIPGQVWVSLLWGHCSFLLGPGAQGSVYALQESISQSCVSSGSSMVGLMVTSSKRIYAILMPGLMLWCGPRAPVPAADHCRPVPPQETLKHSSVLVSVGSLGPGAHKFV